MFSHMFMMTPSDGSGRVTIVKNMNNWSWRNNTGI